MILLCNGSGYMADNNVIYMTDIGHAKMVQTLAEKQAEHKKTFEARTAAIKEVSDSDLNDPEIVQLQQLEIGLNTTLNQLQDTLRRTKVISIDDSMRNTSEVRIGSIVKIQRYNVTADKDMVDEIWEIRGYDETDLQKKHLAYNSPLGEKILSAKAGEVIESIMIGSFEFDITVKSLYKNWATAK